MDPFLDYIEKMKAGAAPTQRDFTCPVCGKTAHWQASRSLRGGVGYVSISAWCDGGESGLEEDGAPEWPSWKEIEVNASATVVRPRR